MTKVIGGIIPPKEHRKLRVEDHVDYILDRLVYARLTETRGVRRDCIYRPEQLGPLWVRSPIAEDGLLYNAPDQVNSPKLVWPVEVGAVFHMRNAEWGDHLHCVYAHSAPPEKLRGSHRFVGKYNIAVYDAYLKPDGEWLPAVNHASWHMGKWIDAGRIGYSEAFMRNVRESGGAPIQAGDKTAEGEWSIGERAAMAQSMALTYRYEWGAQFSVAGSAKVIIPVTPDGIFELFNDRNKPDDRDRRAAMRHWVSQHMRKTPGGDFSRVRDYLRGETTFEWRGFNVTIWPSAFDNDRNKAG